MGYLLKEALKTLCGVNQWSYAVFWKSGCQNTKLLIWEECYYEPASSCSEGDRGLSEISFPDYNAENHNLRLGGDKVHLLVNKMMMDGRVNIVGEGLVGRVVFTGSHQWTLSENYYREIHPPEVLKEVCLQFSAGMQTIAVIPVPPHGAVQFGSYLTIAENMGFVNDVVSLILELGCIPGVLQSENYEPDMINASPFVGSSAQIPTSNSQLRFPSLVGGIRKGTHSSFALHDQLEEANPARAMQLDFSFPIQFMNGVAKAEVIPNSVTWTNQHYSRCILKGLSCTDDNGAASENITSLHATSSGLKNLNLSKTETSFSDSFLAYCSGTNDHHTNKKVGESDPTTHCKNETEQNAMLIHDIPPTLIPGFVEHDKKHKPGGDDLFDVFGADFKDKWFGSCSKSHLSNGAAASVRNWNKNISPSLNNTASCSQRISDSGFFSFTGTDHLLDAVVSKTHPSANHNLDDNLSCKKALNNTGTPVPLLSYGRFGVSDNMKATSSSSLKEDLGTYSQGSSIYDSWIESGHSVRKSNSVPIGYSDKPHETSKTNRKRIKPGENPRPRPKDRQMIQDCVKELREIVPNGAKCSIDALLERTIKHMLFMQNVTKHADKLKKTAESKIISKDGGLVLKDDYGGATWAYEVGSQSMICPIIVEDLNLPHQMLVEMLCEERGLFLEIADIIRGLGLTILKGLMETRNDKIWARFSVEANRSVTRMEIFFSLVRLLDQNSKTGVPQPNSTNDIMVQETAAV